MGVFKAARLTGTAGIAVLLTATIGLATPAHAAEGSILDANAAEVVQDSYIVALKNTPQNAASLTNKYGGTVKFEYKAALNGYAATMSATQARRLAADPAVEYVQADQLMHTTATQANPPSWGLDRVDQRALPLNRSYTYPNGGGAGVNAYIIDTGIRTTHTTFGTRARSGFDAVDGGAADDCNGHGTHVAGTVGGSQYGIAKSVNLIAVRVLNCAGSGTTAQVVAGIDWVTANRVRPAVANMSLGGGANTSIDAAVRRSIAAGVTYAIASGNSNGANACSFSPARVTEAITVNASTNTDARASFSNIGTCTDIFAPGQSIVSSWSTSNTATNNISGTSMATPHVAGAAALVLAGNTGLTPAQVATTLIDRSTKNVVTNAGSGSPNRLLFVNPT
jgi:subtilisin family serine protease